MHMHHIAVHVNMYTFMLLYDMFAEHLRDLICDIQQQSSSSAEHCRLSEMSAVSSVHNNKMTSLCSEMSRVHDENTELQQRLTTETDMRLAGGDASAAQHDDELTTSVVHSQSHVVCYYVAVLTYTV